MNDLDLIPFRVLLDQVVVPARRHLRDTLPGVAVPLVLASLAASFTQVRWSQMVLDPTLQQDPAVFLLSALVFLAVALLALFVFGATFWALTVASMDAVAGRRVDMGRAWRYVFRPHVFATLLVVGIADFLAFMMCFLPALYVVPLFSFTLPVMVAEGRTGTDAMKRSVELFRFNATGRPAHNPWLQTLALLFVGFVLTNAIGGVAQAPFVVAQQLITLREAATSQEAAQQLDKVLWLQVPSSVLGALATSATWLYTTFGTCVLYRELRRRKEAEDLAEAVDRLTGEAPEEPVSGGGKAGGPGISAALLLLLAAVAPLPLAAEEIVPPLAPAAAAHAQLEEIARAEAIQTVPDRPGLVRYALDLGATLVDAIERFFERYRPGTFDDLFAVARVGALILLAVALALLTATVVRALLDSRRRRQPAPEADAVVPVAAAAADRPGGRSRAAWAEELRRRLESDDAAGACHALWWWLAAVLVPGVAEAALPRAALPVGASWTSRELVARAGRADLSAPVRRLDRMLYGAARPGVEDVRRLWADLEEAVG